MDTSSAIKDTMIEPPNAAYGWYPRFVSNQITSKKITSFEFMGEQLIAFRDNRGEVVVLDSVCPHFGADLGKGDICNGQVRCYFHGFYFDENGQCTKGDVVRDPSTLSKISIKKYVVEECAGQVWIWHGLNSSQPDIPLPIKELDWEQWSIPVSSKERFITSSNMCYLSENVIDMQHFDTVHKWKLTEIVTPPHVDKDGHFATDVKVTINLGAQSPYAIVRFLTSFLKLPNRLRFKVHSPGCVVTTSNQGLEINELKSSRNIICMYPIGNDKVSIRAVVSFRKSDINGNVSNFKKTYLKPFDWILGKIVSNVAVADFTNDIKVWNNRKYLPNPKFVKEDGPMLLFRKWYLRF